MLRSPYCTALHKCCYIDVHSTQNGNGCSPDRCICRSICHACLQRILICCFCRSPPTASHPSNCHCLTFFKQNCRCIGRAALQAPPLAVFEEQVVALPVIFTRDWTIMCRGGVLKTKRGPKEPYLTRHLEPRMKTQTYGICKKLRFVQRRHEREVTGSPNLLDI